MLLIFIYAGSGLSTHNLTAKSLSILTPSIIDLSFGLKYISLSAKFKFNLSFFKYSPTTLPYFSLKSVKN